MVFLDVEGFFTRRSNTIIIHSVNQQQHPLEGVVPDSEMTRERKILTDLPPFFFYL